MDNKTRTWIYSALAVAVLLLVWFSREPEPPPAGNGFSASQGPDYSMTGFTVHVLNGDGKLAYKLFAEHMEHFSEKELTLLRRPIIEFFDRDEPRWNLTADKGRIAGSDNNVLLENEVHIRHKDMSQQTDIVANNLHVYTNAKTLYTKEAVLITNPSGKINAVGLQADFGQSRYSLLSSIRSEYYLDSKP